ncbi:hypothetical protein MMIC_P2329 [Mariprofundus micogutta]|uniref:Uncharacterized protein n=1 Tax=Mariprofundus micogutta TaxID=1921010 RepID=A0A1L8CQY4_9PROT|nr:hypothetical protein [Mariprofundus micogutta]GAV21345.1 hypothetical protein MMIC_P2329 [Mariprofundus micogutta]
MIQIEQDETALPVSYAVIYKAVSTAELKMRMQRDFLKKQFAAQIKAARYSSRQRTYIARTPLLWRILYFLNGDRGRKIRAVKLTEAETLASESMALAHCVDMTSYNANMDMAYKLRATMNIHLNRTSLNLPAGYLKFVMEFNPEAFDASQSETTAEE